MFARTYNLCFYDTFSVVSNTVSFPCKIWVASNCTRISCPDSQRPAQRSQRINSSSRASTPVGNSLMYTWITVINRYQGLDMAIWEKEMAKNGMSYIQKKSLSFRAWKIHDSRSEQRLDSTYMASIKAGILGRRCQKEIEVAWSKRNLRALLLNKSVLNSQWGPSIVITQLLPFCKIFNS